MNKPMLIHKSEESVLDQADWHDLVPFVIGGRSRIATCSGLNWIGNDHLAVVNLFGGHLRIYRVEQHMDETCVALKLLHEHTDDISYPENIAISKDGNQLAITHSLSDDHGVSLQPIHQPSLKPGKVNMLRYGRAFHGVDFSPDGDYLIITDVGEPGYVEVLRTDTGKSTCRFDNVLAPLKPKDARFMSGTNLVVIAYGPNAKTEATSVAGGVLSVHVCDVEHGNVDPRPVAIWHDSDNIMVALESCTVFRIPGSGRFNILCADQATDSVHGFTFDPDTLLIDFHGAFSTDLNFPHSVAVSPDGRLAAVANYGDDTIRIFNVESYQPKLNLRQRLRRMFSRKTAP